MTFLQVFLVKRLAVHGVRDEHKTPKVWPCSENVVQYAQYPAA